MAWVCTVPWMFMMWARTESHAGHVASGMRSRVHGVTLEVSTRLQKRVRFLRDHGILHERGWILLLHRAPQAQAQLAWMSPVEHSSRIDQFFTLLPRPRGLPIKRRGGGPQVRCVRRVRLGTRRRRVRLGPQLVRRTSRTPIDEGRAAPMTMPRPCEPGKSHTPIWWVEVFSRGVGERRVLPGIARKGGAYWHRFPESVLDRERKESLGKDAKSQHCTVSRKESIRKLNCCCNPG